jgi:hypothetical protein
MEEIDMANLKDIRNTAGTIELGGKHRTIQFDMNAYAVLEDKYGSVDAAMSQLEKGKMRDLGVMMWVGLLHEEVTSFDEETGEPTGYNITPYQVRSWINSPALLKEASEKLGAALSDGIPQDAAEQAEQAEIKNN